MSSSGVACPRWEAYGAGTELDHFGWWCETFLVQSVDQFAGRPLLLEPWQREFMGEALAVQADGRPFWASVALVVARKNGKTSLLAAYALYRLLNDETQPEILLAAASDRQAGRLFDAVVSFVRRNPELLERLHLREYIGEIARVDGGGKILRMASDPSTLHGYSPSLVVADELHAWSKPSQRKAWSALTTAGGARRQTQVFTITTAGDASERETSILGRLLAANEKQGVLEGQPGLTISRDTEARTLIYNYSAPTADPHDTAAMLLANPASWITEEYLARQAANPELTDSEVLQLHGCVWAASVLAWISAEAWDACLEEGAGIPEGATVSLGVDIGLHHDATAVAVAWRREDGTILLDCHSWVAKRGAVAHEFVEGGSVQLEAVEEHIRRLARKYRIAGAFYDPHFFIRSAQMLGAEGIMMVELTQSSAPMAEAYAEFYAAVLEGRLRHPGDPVLTAHVRATAARMTDRGWKVSKIRQTQRIDATVAAVMGHFGAVRYTPKPPAIAYSW